jgi:light-regulated signal transduction histidine kinase (bacteriophytochrome)
MAEPKRALPAGAAPTSEQMASVEKELADFSYIVSHDVEAAVRHMTAFSRLLIDDFEGELTERQQAYADHVQAAGARCQAMMEQLLAFSRAQHKPMEPVLRDATPTVQLALLELVTEGRTVDADITLDPLGEVFADPQLLTSLFHRLIDNALKFGQPGVRPRIDIRPAHDEAMWRVRITDNGVGVPPTQREKVFGMFQRLHGEDRYPGVGAGLAICRRIARRHGGEVRFLNQDDGACVELALPRPAAEPRKPTQKRKGR